MGVPAAAQFLNRLRKIIGDWPEVNERISHGSPTFWGGKKTFCTFHEADHKYGGRAIWIKATHEAQQSLVEADPDRFFVPPYVGPSGWVAVALRGKVDWSMVARLLEDGYRLVAPKRALKKLDESRDT